MKGFASNNEGSGGHTAYEREWVRFYRILVRELYPEIDRLQASDIDWQEVKQRLRTLGQLLGLEEKI
jgi:hypothetical protein